MKKARKERKKNRIVQGAREALAFVTGEANSNNYRIHVPSDVDVAGVRRRLSLSQTEFSQRFGFNPASVRDWEQGRAKPAGPIRAYLKVIEKDPEAVKKALTAA
jgi:putative transcriptional regulator